MTCQRQMAPCTVCLMPVLHQMQQSPTSPSPAVHTQGWMARPITRLVLLHTHPTLPGLGPKRTNKQRGDTLALCKLPITVSSRGR